MSIFDPEDRIDSPSQENDFSTKPCKHKTNKVDGRWNLLKLNPQKRLLRLCHTCGHVQLLSNRDVEK